MATTGTTLLTWAEFEKLPDGDGFHREIIQGELQILPPPKLIHSRVAKRTLRALLPLEDQGLGEVLAEAGFKLSADPATWVQPDVSFVKAGRALSADEDGYHLGAPDLAIEIVSPSETAADLARKVELLLAAGAFAVWVVYPKTRKVHVHLPDGTSSRAMRGTLALPQLAPGWQFSVAKLFED